jgi:hypothetical protein
MPQHCAVLSAVLLALSLAGSVSAQTVGISIPAWVEGNNCAVPPKFEATLNGNFAVRPGQ